MILSKFVLHEGKISPAHSNIITIDVHATSG